MSVVSGVLLYHVTSAPLVFFFFLFFPFLCSLFTLRQSVMSSLTYIEERQDKMLAQLGILQAKVNAIGEKLGVSYADVSKPKEVKVEFFFNFCVVTHNNSFTVYVTCCQRNVITITPVHSKTCAFLSPSTNLQVMSKHNHYHLFVPCHLSPFHIIFLASQNHVVNNIRIEHQLIDLFVLVFLCLPVCSQLVCI